MKPRADSERTAWIVLRDDQKSRLVRNLNWFHFRPRQIARSWRREEVLTWEVLHALQVLPRRALLGPFIQVCARRNPAIEDIATHLARHLADVKIIEYPLLGLKGTKGNCRSDIGLACEDGTQLWIEAKTAREPHRVLLAQLSDQQTALKNLKPTRDSRVVALIPSSQPQVEWPAIRWRDVSDVLAVGIETLRKTKCVPGDMDGYISIADELRKRILTHESAIAI